MNQRRKSMVAMTRHTLFTLLLGVVLACPALGAGIDEAFPLRMAYPTIPHFTTRQLVDEYENVVVVDVRTRLEYKTAHINTAVPIPLADQDFKIVLETLRTKENATPLVFYGNGPQCSKAYQAAQLAQFLGFDNVFVYDAGMYDWLISAASKATLMGLSPVSAGRITTAEKFHAHLLDYEDFAKNAMATDAIVIDVRDRFQRPEVPRIPGIRNIPLDPLLSLVVSRIWTEKQLLFFDANTRQVKWLQYLLESYGYFNYAFLKGGVDALVIEGNKTKPTITTSGALYIHGKPLRTILQNTQLDNTDRMVLEFVLTNVKYHNVAVVNPDEAYKTFRIPGPLFLSSIDKLARIKYIDPHLTGSDIAITMHPDLAWKGDELNGKAWQQAATAFDAAVQE